jgi:hypothetical protein
MRLPTATIAADSPRAERFIAVFGSRTVPIISPLPHRSLAPGYPDGVEMLRVDVSRLTEEQMERAIQNAAERFNLPVEDVRADFLDPEHGLPILREDMFIAFDARTVL